MNVYNWVDYIGEGTIKNFEKKYNIKVVYDNYDASETVDAKLFAGNSGYDVVLHAGSFIPRLIQADLLSKIDKSRLKNYGNYDLNILCTIQTWDTGNARSVPYMWGDRRRYL